MRRTTVWVGALRPSHTVKGKSMRTSNHDPASIEPVDPDLAEQAAPGHGVPSQDPSAAAQTGLLPEEAEREAKSAYVILAIVVLNAVIGFVQEYRDIICIASLGLFPHVVSHKKRFQLEDAFKFPVCIRRRSFGVDMLDTHVSELLVTTPFA